MTTRRTIRKNQKKWLSSNKNLKILDLGCSNKNFGQKQIISLIFTITKMILKILILTTHK